MSKTFTAQEINGFKTLLNVLLDNATAFTDIRAIKADFWNQLRPLLFANDQGKGLHYIDTLVQAVIDDEPAAVLEGTVLLLPPLSSSRQTSSSSVQAQVKASASPLNISGKRTTAVKRPTPSSSSATPPAKRLRTAAPAHISLRPNSPVFINVSQAAPKVVRSANASVFLNAAAQGKTPWRVAYPWVGEHLWYDLKKFKTVYREDWRFHMTFRRFFWNWAFHAPLHNHVDTSARNTHKVRAVEARLRFISLCIETWGYYGFLERLEYCKDFFWFGGRPSKWSGEESRDGGFFADDLASLSRTDPQRYQFIIAHALLPNFIDEYGYTHVRFILEYGDALNPTSKPKSCLTLEALSRMRRDINSNQVVSDQWVGDKRLDPWKRLCNNHDIKVRQAYISKSLDDGTYDRTTTREITQAELDADDISDFEDDREPTALAPLKLDEETKYEDKGILVSSD